MAHFRFLLGPLEFYFSFVDTFVEFPLEVVEVGSSIALGGFLGCLGEAACGIAGRGFAKGTLDAVEIVIKFAKIKNTFSSLGSSELHF
jgi:hypothetical protein